MLDEKGFNAWAETYDNTVRDSDMSNTYPFAGYKKVLFSVYSEALKRKAKTVLDVGFGTGTLSHRFYQEGLTVYGFDFSQTMVDLAKKKMWQAKLVKHDMKEGLPKDFQDITFDAIISTYAMHHLTDLEKVTLIKMLCNRLSPDGILVIGDVMFETYDTMISSKEKSKGWDDEEHYIILEDFKKHGLKFESYIVSSCAGVMIFQSEVKP